MKVPNDHAIDCQCEACRFGAPSEAQPPAPTGEQTDAGAIAVSVGLDNGESSAEIADRVFHAIHATARQVEQDNN